MRTNLRIVIVVLCLIGGVAALGVPAASGAPASALPFDEEPCPMEIPTPALAEGLRCGYVEVPANRDSDDDRTMRIAVAVYEATGDDPEPDPVVFLPGGPAAPLLEFSWYDATLFAPVRETRDLVFFDHRGAGYSEPNLECPESIAVGRELLDKDLPDEEVAARYQAAWAACLTRIEAEGADFHDFNTTEVASDVVDFMGALGYGDFNVYGASYGTAVAQFLMRDHAGRVRSAVLDSVVPLEADLFAEQGRSVQDALYTMFNECRADAECNAAYPDLENMFWDRVVNAGNLEPFTVEVINPDNGEPVTTTVNGFDMLYFTFVALYDTSRLPELPRLIHEVANGDASALSDLAQLQFAFEGIPEAAHTAVYCNEDVYFTTTEDLERGAEGLRGEIYVVFQFYTDGVLPILEDCALMGIEGPRSPQDALRVTSGLPSLVLSGQYDPITPPKYAAQVAASLSNSYYFDFRATGHGAAYGRTDCAMELITAFLDQPAQSPDGACVAAIPPVDFELPDTLVPGATPTAAPPPLPPSGSIIAPDTGSGPAEQRGTRGVAAWIAIGGAVVLMLGVARWRLVAR